MKTETKLEKLGLGFLGRIMVHIIKLCARGFQPRNPSNTAKRAKLQNTKSNILTCFKQNDYINLSNMNILKHIITKKLKQTERFKYNKKRKEKESLD